MAHIKAKRIDYFDLLRTVAIFFIVLIHCTGQLFSTLPINSRGWLIANLFESISRWGVPIFVMISGAIHLSRKRGFKTFFKKNVLKIIIILFSWNTIYAVTNIIKNGFSFSVLIHDFICGHYHLWFLYMLIGLYFITPFLKEILNDQKHIKLFLLVSFLFGIVFPQISNILSIMPSKINIIGSSFNQALTSIGFGRIFGYSFYYVLGYYLHHKKIKTKTKQILYFSGLIGILITFLATWGLSIITNSPVTIFLNDLAINNVLISIAIFIFAKNYTKQNILSKILIRTSKYSLGIYVVHLIILENILIVLPHLSILLEIPIKTILCFIISLIITFCLQKTPFLKKIV